MLPDEAQNAEPGPESCEGRKGAVTPRHMAPQGKVRGIPVTPRHMASQGKLRGEAVTSRHMAPQGKVRGVSVMLGTWHHKAR